MEKPKGALKSYDKAIELNNNYAEAYYNRAGLYAELDETEKCKVRFTKKLLR